MRLADDGRFDEAQQRLRGAAGELREAAPGSAKAAELLEQAAAMDRVMPQVAAAAYSTATRKQMLYESRNRRQRRTR